MTKYIGKSVKRVEDKRFITGQGKYTDDIKMPGMVYAYILRSPYAHATVNKINTDVAKNCLLYTSPSPRDRQKSRMPSSA